MKPVRYNTFYAPSEDKLIEQVNYSDEILFFTNKREDLDMLVQYGFDSRTVAIWHIKPHPPLNLPF